MANKTHAYRRTAATATQDGLLLLLASLCTPLAPALAADLGVQVLDKATGHPVEGASVCLGTPAEPQQLGGLRTPANGTAGFRDLPAAPLILIVSEPRYIAERRSVEATREGQTVTVLLAKGRGPGFSCSIPAARVETETPGIQSPAFRINGGASKTATRSVRLDISIPEGVNSYRASESSKFTGSDWQPLTGSPVLDLSPGRGKKTVFLQVRRVQQTQGASIEIRSEVASASIVLE